MDRLWRWLREEPKCLKEIVRLVVLCVIVNFVWNMFAAGILQLWGLLPPPIFSEGKITLSFGFFVLLLFAAALEEFLFRFPLYFAVLLNEHSKALLFLAVIASSVLFGYAHGSALNIPLQGAGGVLFSILFLKCGGLHHRPLKGVCVSTAAHFLFKAFVVTMTIPFF